MPHHPTVQLSLYEPALSTTIPTFDDSSLPDAYPGNSCTVDGEYMIDDEDNFNYAHVIENFKEDSPMKNDGTVNQQQWRSVPELCSTSAKKHTIKEIEAWTSCLPKPMQQIIYDSTGKHNPRLQWSGEIVFRHIIPTFILHGVSYLQDKEFAAFRETTRLVSVYCSLHRKYSTMDPSKARGFEMYKNFRSETDFDQERCDLLTAALLQLGFRVPDLVRYLGGTHTGSHRDITQIRRNLTPSVEPKLLEEVIDLFTRGAPNEANGFSSNENFMTYYQYGNHQLCNQFEEYFKEVMVKDSKRGNIILVDPAVLFFIPDLHLTPQAMVDVNNP